MVTNKKAREMLDSIEGGFSLCLWRKDKKSSPMGPWDGSVNLVDPDEIEIQVPPSMKEIENAIENLQELFVNVVQNHGNDQLVKILAATLKEGTKAINQAVDHFIEEIE